MRGTILLGALAVLGTAAWLTRDRSERAGYDPLAPVEPTPSGPLDALESERSSRPESGLRTAVSAEFALRFEDLESEPTELVLRLVTGDEEAPVTDAEVFAIDFGDDPPGIDAEAQARARGRRLECDANGFVHLDLPRDELFVCARKGELFGGGSYYADEAPEATLTLNATHTSRVRVVSTSGAALAGIPILIGCDARDRTHHARTGTTGELLLPNLEWLIDPRISAGSTWFVGVDAPLGDPPLRRFDTDAAAPACIDLVLPATTALRLRVLASDGTPVPVGGKVSLYLLNVGDHLSAVRMRGGSWSDVPLVAGEALVPCAEPGSWLAVCADLVGDTDVDEVVRVPEAGGVLDLRLPENLQVLLLCACDEQGVVLADRKLEWISCSQEQEGLEQLDESEGCVRTDELGRCALVVDREDLLPVEIDPDEPPPKPKHWRGVLRLREGVTQLASGPLEFADLGPGGVRNLGRVQLDDAQPLVRGHVREVDGRPLARTSIGLEQVRLVDGTERADSLLGVGDVVSDADGSFAIFGSCPGGRLRLTFYRDQYDLPAGSKAPEFECGESPELEIVLVRSGRVSVSVLADGHLGQSYTWELVEADSEQHEYLGAGEGPGELSGEFQYVRPGRVKVRLVRDESQETIVEFDDVLVQSGKRTLDPRLLRVPIHGPSELPSTDTSVPEPPPISLHLVDEQGGTIDEGWLILFTHCGSNRTATWGGRVELRACEAGRSIYLWAPGYRWWEGPCPERESAIVLAPALRVSVHIDEPEELRRAGVRVLLDNASLDGPLPDLGGWVEFDAQGDVRIECPAAGRLDLKLRGVLLDASGAMFGAGADLGTEDGFSIEVADGPIEQRFTLAIPAEEWAALAQALGLGR